MKTLIGPTLFLSFLTALSAATVPGVFNTGVGVDGVLLGGGGEVDPHYQLVESPDEMSPGPDAVTLDAGFPVGPWLAEGPNSRWLAPRKEQNTGSAEGDFTYRTTFTLVGFDATSARLTGRWATDNTGLDILVNGESTGITSASFGEWTDFEIDTGFVEGENTLDFVMNNAPTTNNPTGIRVELEVTADLLEGAPPNIIVPPVDQLAVAGDAVAMEVRVSGSEPLTFTWTRDGEVVATESDTVLDFPSITVADSGEYVVTVSNALGSVDSMPVTLTVKDRIPGLFDTGVNDNGELLEDLEPDTHYELTVNPDGEATLPLVHDSTIFPIVDGPYIANSERSKWIAPRGDTAEAAGGDYHYTITFDLEGLDPSTAFITGFWASDNAGTDTLLNGASLGFGNAGGFSNLGRFTIENAPFVSGENTLTFVINNAGSGFTGFRVEDLKGGADPRSDGGDEVPTLLVQPENVIALVGESVSLVVLADGPGELTYEWRRGDEVVGTEATLVLEAIQPDQEGDYVVSISNAQGSVTSEIAMVDVLEPIPGLFDTGVDDEGAALEDLLVDEHYEIVQDPEDSAPDALVLSSELFPIVAGPWVANAPGSKWVGVGEDNNGLGGDYSYQLTFDLSAFDADDVFIEGSWATDNAGTDIVLNGESTGLRNDAQFSSLTEFRIDEGFEPGLNTLEFRLNNAGDAENPTGLLVRGLRGGGRTEDPNLVLPVVTPFGGLESTSPLTLMVPIRNSGRTQTLNVSEAIITGPQASAFSIAAVPASLEPNETVMVALSFDPNGATGNFTAGLQLMSNDPSSPTLTADISAFIPVAPGLLAHYRLDDSDGSVVDASGFGRAGALVTTNGSFTQSAEALAAGGALQLQEGAFAEVPSNVLPALTDFSISLWVNQASSSGPTALLSRGDGQGDPFALLVNDGTLLWFGGGAQALAIPDALTLNQTHHVVVVVEGNVVNLYLDGTLAGTGDLVAFADDARNSLQFGAANGLLGLDGRLDDVQIYERVLNANQANFLFSNPGDVVGANGMSGNGGDDGRFEIVELAIGAGGNVRVNFRSEPNQTYQAEFSTDLVDWEVTVDDIAGEDGITIVRQVWPAGPAGFIRIREKP